MAIFNWLQQKSILIFIFYQAHHKAKFKLVTVQITKKDFLKLKSLLFSHVDLLATDPVERPLSHS